MKRFARYFVGVAVVAAYAPAAQAANDTIRLELRAEVAPFCRLWSSGADEALQMVGDQANLGSVKELCNTRSGYVVTAAFLNLDAGSVVADGETAAIGADGVASFSYAQAGAQTRMWQLVDARKVQEAAPVYLRLSISPI